MGVERLNRCWIKELGIVEIKRDEVTSENAESQPLETRQTMNSIRTETAA